MKRKIAIIFGILLLITVFVFLSKSQNNEKKEIKTTVITKGSLSENLIFEGTVVPENIIPIYVNTPTVVEKLYVNEGSVVKKGDKLIDFSVATRVELQRKLAINKLDLEGITLQLEDLESGSMKLELDNRQLEIKGLEERIKTIHREIKAATFEARTLREQADIKLQLLANDGISSIDANNTISAANQKEVILENLKTDLELTSQKYQLSIQGFDRLKRELNLEETKIRGNYEKLILARKALEDQMETVGKALLAPVEGVIINMKVIDGSPIREGETLLYIAAAGDNHIKIDVPFYQSKWLAQGQEAIVKSKDDFDDKEYIGEVSSVSRVAKVIKNGKYEERVVELEVSLEESKGLKPGFLTEVEIAGIQKEDILLLDSFSVVEENGNNYVYIVEDNLVRKVLVEIGAKTLSEYEVLNLALGTEVVSNPFKVRDGEKIIVKKLR